jgi:hypothetical protein
MDLINSNSTPLFDAVMQCKMRFIIVYALSLHRLGALQKQLKKIAVISRRNCTTYSSKRLCVESRIFIAQHHKHILW